MFGGLYFGQGYFGYAYIRSGALYTKSLSDGINLVEWFFAGLKWAKIIKPNYLWTKIIKPRISRRVI